jgi:hypothetical protein
LFAVAIFSEFLRLNLTVMTRHRCEPCLSDATGSQ